MSKGRARGDGKVRYRIKRFLAAFSDYENAVAFISALEAWFDHRWGEGGEDVPGLLREFDRFPQIDGLTPDFMAYFRRPYVLVGEHMKTFRKAAQGREDVKQLVAYSRLSPGDGGGQLPHDVVVFVDIFSDDVAADQMEDAWTGPEASRPRAPIVILGYSRETDRASGEWYKCKWRKHNGNRQFSTPNICGDPRQADLNALFVGTTHHAIRVDRQALELSKRKPLINDPPPALYSLVRLVYPALFELMDDDERDQLGADQPVVKVVTRDAILSSDILRGVTPRPRVVQEALDFLVSPLGLATRDSSDPAQYSGRVSLKQFSRQDWKKFLSEKAARVLVRKLKSRGRGRRRSSVGPKQLRLFEYP